jgi:hypothetical protein
MIRVEKFFDNGENILRLNRNCTFLHII